MNNFNKLPPNAIELEEVVLGALLIERDAIIDVADFLRPEAFYKSEHQDIYKAILELSVEGRGIDILTVSDNLKKQGKLDSVGGNFYIVNLTSRVASSANIEEHARIIQEKYIKRELIRTSAQLVQDCYNEENDVFDLLSKSELEKDALMQGVISKKEVTNQSLLFETLKDIEKKKEQKGITGVQSGFEELDRITGGWQPSDLIIIAARPGMGKSSFVLQNAINSSLQFNVPGAFFSLEMSNGQLMRKQMAIVADIHLEKFRKNTLTEFDWQQIHSKYNYIEKAEIHWDDTPAISIIELQAKCRRLKKKYDIGYIAIDYLQLMRATGLKSVNREQEIGLISRGLKGIAKELNIPVFALSQLSRAVESRPNKRPMLSDLRESGSIEQDADMVLFLYRPEYYGITEDENGESTDGVAELIIAKHRNGETDDLILKFNKKTTGFSDFLLPIDIQVPNHIEPSLESVKTSITPSTSFDAPF